MIVIFAGCDCTGKSTCFNLMDKSLWRLEKGVANSDLDTTLMDLKMEIKLNMNAIHDRNPLIDDIVYSQVFSKKESKFLYKLDEISETLNKCCIIYFDCDDNIIEKRMNIRGDEYVSKDQIPEIKSEYEKAFKLLKINPYRIDTSVLTPNEVFKKVMEVIECQE